MKARRSVTVFVLVGLLLLANAIWAVLYVREREKYRNAVLCSTGSGLAVIRGIERSEIPAEQTLMAEGLVEMLRANEMDDRKTAILIFQLMKQPSHVLEGWSEMNTDYLTQMVEKWTGRSAGFPDKW